MDRYGLICRTILENPAVTQREMARILDLSLGSINSLTKECAAKGLIEEGDSAKDRWNLVDGGKYVTCGKVRFQCLKSSIVVVSVLQKGTYQFFKQH